MEQQQGQAQPVTDPNQGVSFRSTDIMNTQAARPKEYFVKIRPSAQSRRIEAQERYERNNRYFKEWLGFYRKVIIIIFLSVAGIAIAIAVIVAMILQSVNNTGGVGGNNHEIYQNISLQTYEANV